LTKRELEVLDHLVQGLTNRQIGARMGISANTVANHIQRILRKLKLHNRVQAATYALQLEA
jgi:two-component system, NarL family, nitrate/nitrite response regulator NarL